MVVTRRRALAVGVAFVVGLALVLAAVRDGPSDRHTADPAARTVAQLRALTARISCPTLQALLAARGQSGVSVARVRAFSPVAAVECVPAGAPATSTTGCCSADVPDDTRVDKLVGTVGLGRFLDALELPLDDDDDLCAGYRDVDPYMWVVDARGRALHPRFPLDGCGHRGGPAPEALLEIHWHTLR